MTTHIPVLLDEVLEGLQVSPGKHYIDVTFGGGGHTKAILERTAPDGQVIGIDRNVSAIKDGQSMKKEYQGRLHLVHGNFREFPMLVGPHSSNLHINGILCDLGVSSMELEDAKIGLSFQQEAPLDMRLDQEDALTAYDVVNTYSQEDLASLFSELADDPLARPVSRAIVKEREQTPIETTTQLAQIVSSVYGRRFTKKSRRHPATRVFQALRMKVNHELENLSDFLEACMKTLPSGAIIAVITFHSGEDRIVKQFFKSRSQDQYEEHTNTVIAKKQLERINKKVIVPSEQEIRENPRSRSAKLRLAKVL